MEKHFIDSRDSGGIDSHFSLEPNEFLSMANKIRDLEEACAIEDYTEHNLDSGNRKYRRSLFFSSNLKLIYFVSPFDTKYLIIVRKADISSHYHAQLFQLELKFDEIW